MNFVAVFYRLSHNHPSKEALTLSYADPNLRQCLNLERLIRTRDSNYVYFAEGKWVCVGIASGLMRWGASKEQLGERKVLISQIRQLSGLRELLKMLRFDIPYAATAGAP